MSRVFELLSPAGKALEFDAMSCEERLGRMFEYRITAVSERGDLKAAQFLGKNLSVSMSMPERARRFFNGYCVQMIRGGMRGEWFTYILVLRPWLWFLTRTSDCKIFQGMTVPEIIKEVFADESRQVFTDRLSGQYKRWDYCVQYRETDFDFVMRLMEQEGIYFLFEHAQDKHTLVLCDNKSAHQPCANPELPFLAAGSGAKSQQEFIRTWTEEHEIQTDRVSLDDYDYTRPGNDMRTTRTAEHGARRQGADYETYQFPGEYDDVSEGDQYAAARIESFHSGAETFRGSGLHYGMACGHRFKLKDHPQADFNREYVVSQYVAHISESQERSTHRTGTSIDVSIRAIESAQQFRLPRTTPRPLIHGTQSAEVVGTDEVYTDALGRIKVQFRWDRYGKKDEKSSCWIRVAGPWANSNFGMVSLPRVGSEVVVAFMEGDPDRPLVIGSVYNGDNTPPYPLPGKKSVTGIKSKTLGGGASNFNELSFDDESGKEKIFVQAEKDYEAQIKNDLIQVAKRDQHITSERDTYVTVNRRLHLTVGSQLVTELKGGVSFKGHADVHFDANGRWNGQAGQEIHLKSGSTLTLEAGTSLTLKVGGNYININPSGVFIEGTMVMINSGGAAGSGTGVNISSPNQAQKSQTGADISARPPRPARPPKAGAKAQAMGKQAQTGGGFVH